MAIKNAVTLSGDGTNWASGLSNALVNLSNIYGMQAERKREQENLASDREENKRRFELTREDALTANEAEKSRWQEEQALRAAETVGRMNETARIFDERARLVKEKEDKSNFFKSIDRETALSDIRRQKGEAVFDLSKEELDNPEIVSRIPVYQEDLSDYFGRKYTTKFGEAFNNTTIAPFYGDVSSIAALQQAENEKAKTLNDLLVKTTKNTSSSKNGTSVKGWDDFTAKDLVVKEFGTDTDGGLTFSSGQENAMPIAKSILDWARNDLKVSADDGYKIATIALKNLSTGEKSDRIVTNKNDIDKAGIDAYNLVMEAKEPAPRAELGAYTPTDIREARREEFRRFMEKHRGNTPSSGNSNERLPTKDRASSGNTSDLEAAIMGSITKRPSSTYEIGKQSPVSTARPYTNMPPDFSARPEIFNSRFPRTVIAPPENISSSQGNYDGWNKAREKLDAWKKTKYLEMLDRSSTYDEPNP